MGGVINDFFGRGEALDLIAPFCRRPRSPLGVKLSPPCRRAKLSLAERDLRIERAGDHPRGEQSSSPLPAKRARVPLTHVRFGRESSSGQKYSKRQTAP